MDKTRWNAAREQYQKDKQKYDSYQDTRKDEAVAFGKMMKPTLAQGSDRMSRQYQSTRVSAYNSRAKHSKQEVVEVTPMVKQEAPTYYQESQQQQQQQQAQQDQQEQDPKYRTFSL